MQCTFRVTGIRDVVYPHLNVSHLPGLLANSSENYNRIEEMIALKYYLACERMFSTKRDTKRLYGMDHILLIHAKSALLLM